VTPSIHQTSFTLNEVQSWQIEPAKMINDWLPEGLTLLAGRPKAGKSNLAERASYEIAKSMPVLHCALEYSPLILLERLRQYDNIEPLKLRFRCAGMVDRLDCGGLETLQDEIERIQAKLVVIDTLAMVKRPGDGKGYEGEYSAMRDLQNLAQTTGASVLVLHHTRKPSQDDAGSIFDRILGSTALAVVPDNLLVFDNANGSAMLHGKGRLIEPFQFPLRWANPGFEIDEPDAALRVKAPLQYQIKTHLRTASPCSNKELSEALKKPINSVTNATSKLTVAGEIQKLPSGHYSAD